MGYSLSIGKQETLEWFQQNQKSISRILDIGAGSGTYINLIKLKNSICTKAEWVAIEAWDNYIKEFSLEEKYNTVINQDVRTVDWNSLGKFSVAIAGDVLEHMTKEEAITLVENVLTNCQTLIISIPIVHMPQDEVNGNPFEVHVKDDWSHDEVMSTWAPYIKSVYRKSSKSKLAVYWLSK
jgi:cyclopropane fatty-acyl-phospholipid synthase-like methyltransferase